MNARALRREAKLSQKELARRIRCHPSTYARIERGDWWENVDRRHEAICRELSLALGRPVSYRELVNRQAAATTAPTREERRP